MKGTFKPGDKLTIEIVPFARIKKGDVIIFRRTREEKSDFIVHRVADIAANGLVTRGDNCRVSDEGFLAAEDIIGRVVRFDRSGKTHAAQNSLKGITKAKILYSRMRLMRIVKRMFRKPYLKVRDSGIIMKFWHPEIEIIRLQTPDGPLDKYVHKGRTVAIFWIENNRWWRKRLYEFVIQP
jgi:signal peptidase I